MVYYETPTEYSDLVCANGNGFLFWINANWIIQLSHLYFLLSRVSCWNMAKKQDLDLIGDIPTVTDLPGLVKPRLFTPELLDTIIERIAKGGTLLRICEEPGMPSRNTFHEWLAKVEGAKERYEIAVQRRTERYVEEMTQISDDGLNDTYTDDQGNTRTMTDVIARSKLRVDTRKWIASKLLPKTYGDKVTTEVTGADGKALIPELSETDIARRVAFLLQKGLNNGSSE